MVTKLDAAKIATEAGTVMAITSGKELNPLSGLFSGAPATWFDAQESVVKARKKWIAGQMEFSGCLMVDEGAAKALAQGKSLLPAGIKELSGTFHRGDVVSVHSLDGAELGCGIVSYDARDAHKILGCRSAEIESILGMTARGAMIHRDNLVLKAKLSELE
jgi:glutamate 5-kinase